MGDRLSEALAANGGISSLERLSLLEQARELIEAIQRLSLCRSLTSVQEVVRTAARRLMNADGATFVLRDGRFCFYADEDAVSPLWKGQRFPLDTCISGWAMLNRQPAVIEDIYVDDRIPHDAYRPTFVKSLVMVPIRTIDPVGAIGAYWAHRHRATDEEVRLVQALADSTAIALDSIRVYEELEESRLETLQRLAIAAEYRDAATHEHTVRVARTAELLGAGLGLAERDLAVLGQAAMLHDIGKIAVPDSILLKPGALTAAEFEQVKTHTTAGAAILEGSRSEVLRVAWEVCLGHHEWWDGSGYPHGLAGTRIPLSARIVALADVLDALTHERPYHSAWPVARAVDEIRGLGGRQFDPAVVEAFLCLDADGLVR